MCWEHWRQWCAYAWTIWSLVGMPHTHVAPPTQPHSTPTWLHHTQLPQLSHTAPHTACPTHPPKQLLPTAPSHKPPQHTAPPSRSPTADSVCYVGFGPYFCPLLAIGGHSSPPQLPTHSFTLHSSAPHSSAPHGSPHTIPLHSSQQLPPCSSTTQFPQNISPHTIPLHSPPSFPHTETSPPPQHTAPPSPPHA